MTTLGRRVHPDSARAPAAAPVPVSSAVPTPAPASTSAPASSRPLVTAVAPGVFRVRDTCEVYVVLAPQPGSPSEREAELPAAPTRTAVMIDFGSGLALDHLAEMGVDRVTDVLMTHHHRDQGQGLRRAVDAGIAVHVPPVEQDLFAGVDELWRTRPLDGDYNLRQDRFSLLESVPVTSVVPEYRRRTYSGVEVEVLPTPGHTTGSVTYLLERQGRRLAFTGDLIYAPGKVWSLAATQWSYTDNEGPAFTVLSCHLLAERDPDLLLPSHGEPMDAPVPALTLLAERMQAYVDSRRLHPWDLHDRLEHPYRRLSQHLLINTSSNCCSYVLLSDSGAALLVDFGYDMVTGNAIAGHDRAAHRPWLASLRALRRDFGVTAVEVVLATHHHDDHVAGMNLLREVEGTQVWAPVPVAEVLEDPRRFDLPCLWVDPVPVDRRLPVDETFRWREYTLTAHDLPGHSSRAVAYEVRVDGAVVLATGDQQEAQGVAGERNEVLNYQYRSGFHPADYQRSAALYRRVRPDLLLTGHWGVRRVDDDFLAVVTRAGDAVVDLHAQLLPDDLDLGADPVLARIEPYRSAGPAGAGRSLTVQLRNPYAASRRACVRLVVPEGWPMGSEQQVDLGPGEEAALTFLVRAGRPGLRQRVAVDVTVGDLRFGQQAEALLDVTDRPGPAEPAGRPRQEVA